MSIFCPHLSTVCNPEGLRRVSRAAEAVFTASYRPLTNISKASVPRCLHPECVLDAAHTVFVCLHCVYMSCLNLETLEDPETLLNSDQGKKHASDSERLTHLFQHFRSEGHFLHLSVEHQHMYCVRCKDFVFNRYLDGAIALQKHMSRAKRRSFTSSISPLDSPVHSRPALELSMAIDRSKRRRLLTPSEWTPSDIELGKIAASTILFAHPRNGTRPPAGLFNLGNSCYMNSVLQAFLNAPPLRNFFLADEHRPYCKRITKSECLACAIDQLVCDSIFTIEAIPNKERSNQSSSSGHVPFLVPQSVLDIMWRNAEHLATYAQHDAHEFLIAALNVLNVHCRHEKFPEVKKEKSEPVSNGTIPSSKRSATESRRKLNPKSPVMNIRADPGGDFSQASLLSINSSTSIVQSIFSGTLQSDVICRACGNSSPTLERFYDISLDVDKVIKSASNRRSRTQSPAVDNQTNASGNSKMITGSLSDRHATRQKGDMKPDNTQGLLSSSEGRPSPDAHTSSAENDRERERDMTNSLHECLGRFTEPELLGPSSKMHCINCNARQESSKQMSIRTLPPIICFHFKRFEKSFANVRRSEMVKIDMPVEFPADGLDLSPFQTSKVLKRRQERKAQCVTSIGLPNKPPHAHHIESHKTGGECSKILTSNEGLYDLFAVVNHNGRIDSGHYTSIIRRQGEWFRCDDDKVNRIAGVGDVIRSQEAYLVFYVQRFPNVQY